MASRSDAATANDATTNHPLTAFAARVVCAPWFEPFMIGLILFNALLIGLETFPEIEARHAGVLHFGNQIILTIFIAEAALKITAVAPRFGRYFGNGWNLFDFSIVVLSLVPATGDAALVSTASRGAVTD